MQKVVIVIPCFNEEQRFDGSGISGLLEADDVGILLVDDGSSDGTLDVLKQFCTEHPRASFLSLPKNVGKAEAVRHGLKAGVAGGAEIVGYFDADLATPPKEFLRMLELLRTSDQWKAVLASRVRLLGRDIQRGLFRHYAGRVFATAASLALRLPVYDTQCGAKIFVSTPALREALETPFESRWVFDVYLIARLLNAAEPLHESEILEYPLLHWRDIPGSKLRFSSMVGAGIELALAVPALRRRLTRN